MCHSPSPVNSRSYFLHRTRSQQLIDKSLEGVYVARQGRAYCAIEQANFGLSLASSFTDFLRRIDRVILKLTAYHIVTVGRLTAHNCNLEHAPVAVLYSRQILSSADLRIRPVPWSWQP